MVIITRVLLFLSLLYCPIVYAQIINEPFNNYASSKFENIENVENMDVIILYDRTYYETKAIGEQVIQNKVIHRKIKINSLHGLEKFNKLYIPTFNDLDHNLKYISCKAKVLKKDGKVIQQDTSNFVSTTLPANAPFFYKKEGKVKMLALSNIKIGDQIEYVYKIQHIYNYSANYFYKHDFVPFSSGNYCLEKSIYFQSPGFNVKIWPFNFHNGISKNTNFTYKDGFKITLNNILTKSDHLYIKSNFIDPYIKYTITKKEIVEEETTWQEIAEDLSTRNKTLRENGIFRGDPISDITEEFENEPNTIKKFELLSKKLNKLLERNFYLYERYNEDIDVAWSFAKILSKLMEKLEIPVEFYFAVNKNNGILKTDYISIYQFDKVFISFKDKFGEKHFLTLIEPYTEIDDIKKDYQGTMVFVIKQNEKGDKTHSFEKIPTLSIEDKIVKNINLKLLEKSADTAVYEVKGNIIFEGDAFLELKPYLMNLLQDSSSSEIHFTNYIERQIPSKIKPDTIFDVNYEKNENTFSISYTYIFSNNSNDQLGIYSLSPNWFIKIDFYTPFRLRDKRIHKGYLYQEHDIETSLKFDLGNHYKWIENTLLKNEIENTLGKVAIGYITEETAVTFNYSLHYKSEEFQSDEWKLILDIRDVSNSFFDNRLYFTSTN